MYKESFLLFLRFSLFKNSLKPEKIERNEIAPKMYLC